MKIHFFNPGHETAVLNQSPYYMSPANTVVMQRELASLPIWYAEQQDSVFVWNKKDAAYWQYINENLENLPQIITKDELAYRSDKLCLWGVSPQSIHFWNELNLSQNANVDIPVWKDEYMKLTSRIMAKDALADIQSYIPEISEDLLPVFFDDLTKIEIYVQSTKNRLLAKAPYSSSGRGLLWLPVGELTRTERQILHGILKKQGQLSIEKVLDKQFDFAMEFICDGMGNVTFEGYSLFETNSKGAYSSNILKSQQAIFEKLTKYVDPELLNQVCERLKMFLSREYASVYEGCIGIDMMMYKTEKDQYKLHPCVEINMRYNMGYLSLMFSRKYLDKNSNGRFYIDFSPRQGEIYLMHSKLMQENPALFSNGKLQKGYLPLCPVYDDNHYRAYVLID